MPNLTAGQNTYQITVRYGDRVDTYTVEGGSSEEAAATTVAQLRNATGEQKKFTVIDHSRLSSNGADNPMQKLWDSTFILIGLLFLMVIVERRLRRWAND